MYEATARTVILGPDEPEPPDRIAVRLHFTGMLAKGWGWEPDTKAAIRWLEEHVQPGMTVCDIGCGTGLLAIVATRLGGIVVAYEIEESVRSIAMANFNLNEVDVDLWAEYDGQGGFDLVVANLGDIDYEGLGISISCVKPGGHGWITPMARPLPDSVPRDSAPTVAELDPEARARFIREHPDVTAGGPDA